MTTLHWLLLDHAVALLAVVAWFGAAAAAALGRHRPAVAAALAAVLLTAARPVTVTGLAGSGWWFVQEKVVLGLPLTMITALPAAVQVGRAVFRTGGPGAAVPTSGAAALFVAGHGSLTALLVTLGVGYPLEWSTGLIAVALWGAASLLTLGVLCGPAHRSWGVADPEGRDTARPSMSRRRLINATGALAVVVAAGAGIGLTVRSRPSYVTGGGPGPSARTAVPVTQLRGPTTPAPGGRTVRQLLTAQTMQAELASGRELQDAWTYNGRVPGPPLVATEGDLVEVTLRNADIDEGVTIHWHGYDVACGEDGAPGTTQVAVAPGEEFVYRFRAEQTGTYWYHTHQTSHVGVRKGLYGTLVVHPRHSPDGGPGLDLTLPLHTFDGVLLVGDRSGPIEHAAPERTPVRIRVINTDSTPHSLALAGTTFRVAAVDGRELHQPDEVSKVSLRLPAGGRYDLSFDMPADPVALVVDGDSEARVLLRPDGTGTTEPDTTGTENWSELDLLHYGEPTRTALDTAEADRHFTLVLDRGIAMVDGSPTYAHTVNGLGHPSIPDQLVTLGDLVRFTVVNRSLETHPWHLHGHPVLVLSRNDERSTGSPLWVDTFDVRPGEVWDVAFAATNPGVWMNHCHNLPHADQGMMLRLAYDGFAPVESESHAH